jgi:general secretion pathway protein C
LAAQWFSNSSDVAGRLATGLESALYGLAQPVRARRLRQGLLALLSLWAVLALARLAWVFVPVEDAELATDLQVINPVSTAGVGSADAAPVDIQRMMDWHLFGEAGAEPVETPAVPEQTAASGARDGIENGARETRLDLKLQGIVASSEDGLGHAIIEHKKRQSVYAVDDKLPVKGEVVLAKVMPQQVVLDNGGKYELLKLFEKTKLDTQVQAQQPARSAPRQSAQPAAKPTAGGHVDKRSESSTTAVARQFRSRLYSDPQSLAQVVNVSAVRQDGSLLGYRVAPGRDRAQFEQLGFKAGDLVTGINGIALTDPANTMRLYQTMRSATEAVFELRRGDEQLTVSVNLGNDDAGDGGAATKVLR